MISFLTFFGLPGLYALLDSVLPNGIPGWLLKPMVIGAVASLAVAILSGAILQMKATRRTRRERRDRDVS